MAGLEAHYSVNDIEARILAALRATGLDPEQRLSPVKLGALDHFRTGGFRASLVLQDLVQIRTEDRALDISAGLAGPARMLDKPKLYQEMVAGESPATYFPLPWATDAADNFLISASEIHTALTLSGFKTLYFENVRFVWSEASFGRNE